MTISSLTNAPDEVKLAVDLILLMETNNIDIDIALKALDIVKKDLQKKQQNKSQSSP